MPHRINDVIVNGAIGATGATAAATPAFYETDIWVATVATMGFLVLILTLINSLYQLRRNLLHKKSIPFTKSENVNSSEDSKNA